MGKLRVRVGVLFGGRSCEHEVSVESAKSVLSAIDTDRYEVVPIGVTKTGEWVTMDVSALNHVREATVRAGVLVSMLPDPGRRGLVALTDSSPVLPAHRVDVVIPLVHGPMGEDGTVQGLLDLAGVPYVGSGVLGSAVGMDKTVMKAVLAHAGLTVTPYRTIAMKAWHRDPVAIQTACELAFAYPWFVKPARMGSSVGVSKVHDCRSFTAAMLEAGQFDDKVLVEAAVQDAREIEVGVLGNDEPKVSVAGEVVPSAEFYDYRAKYLDSSTALRIPAPLPPAVSERIRACAVRAFKAIDCAGLARVDFLLRGSDQKIFVSEINTLPGFTAVSMFPRLWEASGVGYTDLIDTLIELAIERHQERGRLRTDYKAGSVHSSAA